MCMVLAILTKYSQETVEWNFNRVLQNYKQRDQTAFLRAHYNFISHTLSHHTSIPFYKVKLQELSLLWWLFIS